jgi:hypothetical protein
MRPFLKLTSQALQTVVLKHHDWIFSLNFSRRCCCVSIASPGAVGRLRKSQATAFRRLILLTVTIQNKICDTKNSKCSHFGEMFHFRIISEHDVKWILKGSDDGV